MQTPRFPLVVMAVVLSAVSSACSDEAGESSREPLGPRQATAAALPISGQALEQMRALGAEKRARTPTQRKLASQLLLATKARRGDPQLSSLGTLASNLKVSANGTVLVDIKARVDEALLARIRALGGSIVSSVPRFDAVQAHVPLDQLELVAAEPNVRSIMPALGWVTNKEDTSEGDVAHDAFGARALSGVTGSGVTVGVLSDGVATLAQRQAFGDLPLAPQLQVLPGQEGEGDEGTAMLEIVHDLAPDAALLYATALPSAADFAQNILDLREAGANIIVDDVGYLGEAAFQDDLIAQAVNTVTADGALYFSAAGNDGNLNDNTPSGWEGDYDPMPPPNLGPNDWPDAHDFGGGVNYCVITVDPPNILSLQWADPYGASNNDYDFFMLNATRTAVVSASTGSQSGVEDPLEWIDSEMMSHEGRTLVVARFSGEPRMLRLSAHRGQLNVQSAGQIWGHPAAKNAFAIGAVEVDTAGGGLFVGGSTNPVEWFTSDGPRRVFFETDGTALTPGNFLSSGGLLRQKPDFAAADGVSTATPGFDPFHGTSAAAPHAAALTALLLEARPSIAALGNATATAVVRNLLASAALDIEAAGFDRDSGGGLLMATGLLDHCNDGDSCDDGNPCTQTDTCELGDCVGSNPIGCPAPDQCQLASACDPGTGECEYPELDDGTTCDDGSACTESDSCQDGVCTGANPVVCDASDQCHLPGTCDPGTGECSNPQAGDGSACTDGDSCTQSDSCQGGQCEGGAPVVCEASDQCHLPGTCDPSSGACSNPEAVDGTVCSDGSACTQSDSCMDGACTGANPVVCPTPDQCHLPGTCDPGSGACSNPEAVDGTDCNDGSACTQADSCQDGACTGANPVVCPAPDQCHLPGTCDPGTGECSNPEANDGATCNDGNACTQADSCMDGACTGANPVVCSASDQCHLPGTCDPGTGECSNPEANDGNACSDDDACTQADSCMDGACTGANPVICSASDQCHVPGTCNPDSGACSNPQVEDGTVCDAGECSGGQCQAIGAAGAGGSDAQGSAGDGSEAGSTGEGGGNQAGVGGNSGGSGAVGGNSGASGVSESGGNTAQAGTAAGGKSSGGSPGPTSSAVGPTSSEESGCGCRLPGKAPSAPGGALLAGLGALLVVTRRRSSRRVWY